MSPCDSLSSKSSWGLFFGTEDGASDIFAIAEVKTKHRVTDSRPEVLWQETCEMVAWISHEIKNETRRDTSRRMILFSRDNTGLYLAFAQARPAYSGKDGYIGQNLGI